MSFIENWRDALTRALGGGYKPGHLSDITEEQKQKWDDDRAKSFVENYRKEHPGAEIKSAKLGDAQWGGDPTGFNAQEFNDLARGSAGAARNHPGIYEFSYLAPKNAGSIDDGETVSRKGIVYMMGPKAPVDKTGKPRGETYVYEAMLDDGTVLSADEFEEFLAANKSSAVQKYPLENGTASKDFGNTRKAKEALIEDYRELAKNYVRNPYVGEHANESHTYWDKNKRLWMSSR